MKDKRAALRKALKEEGCDGERIDSELRYEKRVQKLEQEGISRSDAQAIVAAEELMLMGTDRLNKIRAAIAKATGKE